MFNLKGKEYDGILWLLDPGHGSDTKGKRSPVWSDNTQLLEWEFNRAIVKRMMNRIGKSYSYRSIQLINLVPETHDVSLSERTRRANKIKADNPTKLCVYLSIHGDAFTSNTARGSSIFTSPGVTMSDYVAEVFKQGMQQYLLSGRSSKIATKRQETVVEKPAIKGVANILPYKWKYRGLKEARFTVLMKTKMPAILWETGFYTNESECKYMMSNKGRHEIALSALEGILRFENSVKGLL